MEAQTYYESLVAQGYSAEQAQQYTAQHYPGFGAAPAPAPAPAPVAQQPQMMTGAVGAVVQPQAAIAESNTTSKGMRITSGILGILMSLALIGYSLLVIGMWVEISEDVESDMELLGLFAEGDDDVADFHDSLDSLLSTISYFYYAILLVSIGTLVISFMQFLDKPWGTKALLGSTGLLLVMLLATGAYEISSYNQIDEDYEELTYEGPTRPRHD